MKNNRVKIILLIGLLTIGFSSTYSQTTKSVKEIESNKKLMLHIVEQLFNKGDTTIAQKYFVPEFAQEEIAFTKLIRTAFPDLIIVVDIQVAEKNLVAARWVATGTHQSTFLGVPASQKKVSWKGSWFWTFKNGIVVDGMGKGSWDALGLLKQLQSK